MAAVNAYGPHPQHQPMWGDLRSPSSVWHQPRRDSVQPMLDAPSLLSRPSSIPSHESSGAASASMQAESNGGIHMQLRKEWTAGQERILMEPYDYIAQQKGKNIRGQMIKAFNEWLKVPPEKLEIIEKVVSMLHNASLMIDDIEDFSTLRRGIPVAHSIFGVAQTINTANYIYFLAMEEVMRLGNPQAVGVFTAELQELHRGQGLDLFWRDNFQCPTEEEYVQMVVQKTGGLFRLAIRLMQTESDCKLDLCALGELLGVLFQIRDDYLNLESAQYSDAKGLCEDLSEGKFSFLVVHGIQAHSSDHRLLNIVQQRPKDDDVKKYAVLLLQQLGSFDYTKRVMNVLVEQARTMVEDFGGQDGEGQLMSAFLNKMDIPRQA